MKNRIRLNKEEKFMLRIFIIVLIGLIIRSYGLHIREQTIKSAELMYVTETGYAISFEGEEHYYSFS